MDELYDQIKDLEDELEEREEDIAKLRTWIYENCEHTRKCGELTILLDDPACVCGLNDILGGK